MKLKSFHVREFQSIRDSGPIDVGEITCLVGKNESGKTALLKALYRLNPVVASDNKFDVTSDYPRMEVEDYRLGIEANERGPATPIKAVYALEEREIAQIRNLFGAECAEFTLSKDYNNKLVFDTPLDGAQALKHLMDNADFSEHVRAALSGVAPNVDALMAELKEQEQTGDVNRITEVLATIKQRGVNGYIYDSILKAREPKFLYFDEYYQMTGHENIQALVDRETKGQLKSSDYPLLGLVRLARLKLPELLNPPSTIDLKNRLEGASNHLSRQVLKYWSQNRHLRMAFDVRHATAGDPPGMQQGTNIWGGVFDNRHLVTTELGSRSRGFVWFFSFLAWYSDIKRTSGPMILLLDEPGLTLHAKAQQDLLRYFESELKGHHQLIYSTHSPFMIDPERFDRVRIVQDKSLESDKEVDESTGTKVITDVFTATPDSLFPLQGALGYELHQTLFIGPYTVVVEGAADLLYIQAFSALLQKEGRTGLDARWTVTPVGGSAKVPTFVALLGSQKGMTIATLIDKQISDEQKIEALYREKLLKRANLFTFADFTKTTEADIEDMFDPEFYVELVNAEFRAQLAAPIDATTLISRHPRILQRLDQYFAEHPLKEGEFSHYRPARYFNENLTSLAPLVSSQARDRFEAAFKALNGLLK